MEPSLLPGDFVLVDRFAFGPTVAGAERALLPVRAVRRGDVVVVRLPWDPRRHLVKRVVGLPGETVTLRGGTVYIDGMSFEEPCLPAQGGKRTRRAARPGAEGKEPQDRFGPVTVPPRHYFVLGDNRRHSQDSRLWGPLPHDALAGRVVATFWSSAPPEIVAVAPPNVAAAFHRRLQAAAPFRPRDAVETDPPVRVLRQTISSSGSLTPSQPHGPPIPSRSAPATPRTSACSGASRGAAPETPGRTAGSTAGTTTHPA